MHHKVTVALGGIILPRESTTEQSLGGNAVDLVGWASAFLGRGLGWACLGHALGWACLG